MESQSNDHIQSGMYDPELRQRVESVLNDVLKCLDDVKLREEQITSLKEKNLELENQLTEANNKIASLEASNTNMETKQEELRALNNFLEKMDTSIRKRPRVEIELVNMSPVDKHKQIANLQAELANKNKQLDKCQMENTLLRKQVGSFNGFFEVFVDKLPSVLNNFFADSDDLLEVDNTAIGNFIKDVIEHKQKIMDTRLESDVLIQEDIEQSEDQLTRNALSTILIKDLECEVETIVQSNDVDETNWFVCKLNGLLCAERVKRRLFEAKSLQANTSALTDIANHVTQFAEDIIAESKEDTDTSHPDLEQLQESISKIYGELKGEQALIKKFENKISLDEKKNALSMLSKQCMCAVKKLCKRAKTIRKRKPNAAMKLVYKDLWYGIIHCYKILGRQHKVIDLCTKMMKNNPKLALSYYHRARIYYEMQQYENATVDVNRALELDPNHKAAQDLKSKLESKLQE